MPYIRTRPDFSNALVHLTRGKEDEFGFITEPFDVLKQILQDRKIIGSGNEGYVRGNNRAVCFSETPIANVRYIVESRPERYSCYGIMITKEQAFRCGGRPVIYLPVDESNWIPEDEYWRHVRFEYGRVDFTWEREWRIKGDLDLSAVNGFYVLVWSEDEKDEIERRFTRTLEIKRCLIMEEFNNLF